MAFAWGFAQSLVQHPAWPKGPESCTWGLDTVKVFLFLGLAALCIRPFCVNRISIQTPALFYLEDTSKKSKARDQENWKSLMWDKGPGALPGKKKRGNSKGKQVLEQVMGRDWTGHDKIFDLQWRAMKGRAGFSQELLFWAPELYPPSQRYGNVSPPREAFLIVDASCCKFLHS